MLEILQFYVSGFWTWLGLTVGLWFAGAGAAMMACAIASSLRRARR